MKHLFIFSYILSSVLLAQPKPDIEFQLNTISGVVLNSESQKPLSETKVSILTGNNILKDSTFTDDDGHFIINKVGYMWKPKVRFYSRDFLTHSHPLKVIDLDADNSIHLNQSLTPISEDQKIPTLAKNSIEKRAETFLIKGNVFYYLSIAQDKFSTERIIIKSKKAIDTGDGLIVIKVNDSFYDPVRCYVPQMGKYENLAHIIDHYFQVPLFEPSGLPVFLSDNLLKPSVIYGTVSDANTKKVIVGAEVRLAGLPKRRITDKSGKYAFQVDNSGTYQVLISPPFGYQSNQTGISEIIVRSARGGWYMSNHYLIQ